MKVLIYNGEGVSKSFSFFGLFPNAVPIDAKTLAESDWDADLFVMPGGKDCPYHAALQGAGNRKIRQFVEKGGLYLGICAGAYYGCAEVDFDRGHPLQVIEKRELKFFDGKVVGPAYGLGTYDYQSERGARFAKLLTADGFFYAYYNGGPTFQGNFENANILASYADLPGYPPAIIECKIGLGKAILSGVHVETLSELNFSRFLGSFSL